MGRRASNKRIFSLIYRRLCETGSVGKRRGDVGGPHVQEEKHEFAGIHVVLQHG